MHCKVSVKLTCAFAFAYADCWFSHEAARIVVIGPRFATNVIWLWYRSINIVLQSLVVTVL